MAEEVDRGYAYGSTSQIDAALEEGRVLVHSVEERRSSGSRRRLAAAAAGAGAALLLVTIAATVWEGGSSGRSELVGVRSTHGTALKEGDEVTEHVTTTSGMTTISRAETPHELSKIEFFPPGIAGLSNLKPRVVPDPDTYYNVFDPAVRNKTEHLRWTRTQVRKEVLRMLKLIDIVGKKEGEDAKAEREGVAAYKAHIGDSIAAVQKSFHAQNASLSTEVSTTEEAITSLKGAFAQIDSRLTALDLNRTGELQNLWDVVRRQEQEIDQTGFQLGRAEHQAYGDIGIADMKWKEQHERLLADIKRGDATLEQMAAEVRFDLVANMSMLVRSLEDLASNLRDRDLRRQQDLKELWIMLGQAQAALEGESKTWGALGGDGSIVAVLGQGKDDETTEVGVAEEGAKQLIKKVAAQLERGFKVHNETIGGTQRVLGGAVVLGRRLEGLEARIKALMGMFDQLDANQARLKAVEAHDVQSGEEVRGRLTQRVADVSGLRGDMQKVEGEVRMMVSEVSSQAQSLANLMASYRSKADSGGAQLQGATARLGAAETSQQTLSAALDSNFEDTATELEPLYAELTMAQGEVDEFNELRSRATRVIANLTAVSETLTKEQDGAQKELVSAIGDLRQRINSHVSRERGSANDVLAAVKGLQKDVEKLQRFRMDTLDLEGQLKMQVGDTTEALGILDSKFSSQNNELGTHFGAIRDGIDSATEGKNLQKVLTDTEMRYQTIDHDMRDLTSEVDALDKKHSIEMKRLVASEADFWGADDRLNVTFAGYESNIAKHPPLLADMQEDADRTPPPPPPVPSSLAVLPEPAYINWWLAKRRQSGIQPFESFPPLAYAAKLDDGKAPMEGFISGEYKLPFYGHWRLQYYVTGPKWSPVAPKSMIYPLQSEPKKEVTRTDTVDITINGEPTIHYVNDEMMHGKKEVYVHEFEGDTVRFKFEFQSDSPDRRTHPFVSPGEVTFVKDRVDPGMYTGGMGKIKGMIINSETGLTIKEGSTIRSGVSGWSPHRFRVDEEVFLGLYRGSNLVYKIDVSRGKFSEKVKAGKYTCQAIGKHFYASIDTECEVPGGGELEKDIFMAVVLDPGYTRAVVTWAGAPDNLDVKVTTPVTPACDVTVKHRQCGNSGPANGIDGPPNEGLELVEDAYKGFGPETVNFGGFVAGKYDLSVSGSGLEESGAQVSYYTPMSRSYFKLGSNGYVKSVGKKEKEWEVFSIDGTTLATAACAEATCKGS